MILNGYGIALTMRIFVLLFIRLLSTVAPRAQSDIINLSPRIGATARIYTTDGDTLNVRKCRCLS